jgi:hypothetical protein
MLYFSECIGSGGSAQGSCAQGFGTCCFCEYLNISLNRFVRPLYKR